MQCSPSVCQGPNYHQNMQIWSLKKIRDYKDLKLRYDFKKISSQLNFFSVFEFKEKKIIQPVSDAVEN